MAVQTLPLSLDFTVYAGVTFFRQFRWLTDGTTPQDLTDWSALMLVGPEHGTAVLELTSEADEGITLSDEGLIVITMSAEQTDALAPADLFHVLDLTDPDDTVIRFFRGRMWIVNDVERAP